MSQKDVLQGNLDDRKQVFDICKALLPADIARGEAIGYLFVYETKPQMLTAHPSNCLTGWMNK